ncbi:MAG: hypothetical protein H7836_12940 [Magnetococcus sp. YQC-3]
MIKTELKQVKLDYFRLPSDLKASVLKDSLGNLHYKLSECGKFLTLKYHCKLCESECKHNCVSVIQVKHYCENRFCNKPECLVTRFVRNRRTLDDIPRFKGLRFLSHFAIGFPLLEFDEFSNGFSKHKKRYEQVIHSFIKRMNKLGFSLQGVRVWDFAFTKEGKVYPHFHFGCIPVGSDRWRALLIKAHEVIKKQISSQRYKTPFHLQSFNLASKTALFNYFSIRSAGLYKYNMTENPDYKPISGNLKESIQNKKYITLGDILTSEQYLLNFYGKTHFLTFGKFPRVLRHGSNIADDLVLDNLLFCKVHGILQKEQCRVEISWVDIDPPPLLNIKEPEILEIQYVKI